MFGFFNENKNRSSWFSWSGMDRCFSNDSCNSLQDHSYFDKEPERDHFQDWLDLKWAEGDPEFDPMRPL